MNCVNLLIISDLFNILLYLETSTLIFLNIFRMRLGTMEHLGMSNSLYCVVLFSLLLRLLAWIFKFDAKSYSICRTKIVDFSVKQSISEVQHQHLELSKQLADAKGSFWGFSPSPQVLDLVGIKNYSFGQKNLVLIFTVFQILLLPTTLANRAMNEEKVFTK